VFLSQKKDGEGMASTQLKSHPGADAEFQQFLQWRAECHAQSQRLEQMDDVAIPSHFSEHVSYYRYARACAVMDRETNPESVGIEAVRNWLHRGRSESHSDD
jgi:hypothetical protein